MASSPRKRKRSAGDVDISNIIPQKRSSGTPPLSPNSVPRAQEWFTMTTQLLKDGFDVNELYRRLGSGSRLQPKRQSASDMTSWSAWHPHPVGKDPKYRCYRPQHAVPNIPVILLFEPLSKFAVNLNTIAITDGDLSMAQKFWNDVHSEDYVQNHQQRVVHMVMDIGRYCNAPFIPSYHLEDGSIVDGIAMIAMDYCIWLEFKSEPGKSGDPYFQVLDYAFRSAGQCLADHQTYGVAICVSGPHLQMLAVTIVGGEVWSHPLGIIECYGGFEALEATARVWASVRQFLSDYKPVAKFTSDPVPWPVRGDPDLQCYDARRLLYTYKNKHSEKELAKFVQSYCEDAHKAWMPYAPELRGEIDTIAGKWRLVRMEYLSQETGWQPAADILIGATDDPNHLAKIKSFIVQMVQTGHTQGFVHGDMRLPNILLRKGDEKEADGFPRYDVRLLDFDWSGRSDLAKYPSRLNTEVQWPPGAKYGAVISKEHDRWFADHLEQQLQ